MARPKPIPLPIPEMGVVSDGNPEDMPLGSLIDAQNWIWDNGELKLRPGFTTFGNDINQRPTAFAQYLHNDGAYRIVKATTAGWWKLTGSTWSDISGSALTGTATDLNVFRVFQKSGASHLLGTNGANTMKKWDGNAATYSDVGGTPARCKTMMVLGDRVIIGHLLTGGTVSGLAVDVSALQNFDAGWGTILTAIVGAETEGNIVAMRELGSLTGTIYKEDAIVDAIAQSGNTPFRFPTHKTRIAGPASARSLTGPAEGYHLVLAVNGAIMIWDGIDYKPLGNKFQSYISRHCNFTNLNRSFAAFDPNKNYAWFFFPEVGATDPMIGIVISMDNLSMWPFRLPWSVSAAGRVNTTTGLTIGDLTGQIGGLTQTIGELGSVNIIARLMVGEVGGQDYENNGDTDAGSPIAHYLQYPRAAFGDGTRYKTVNGIEHRFQKTASTENVSFQIGISDSGDDEVLSAAQTVDVGGAGPYKTGPRKSGKYLSMRVSGAATHPLTYRGSFASIVERGNR